MRLTESIPLIHSSQHTAQTPLAKQDAVPSYAQLFDLFLDPMVSTQLKQQQSTLFLKQQLQQIHLDEPSLPQDINQIGNFLTTQHEQNCQLFQQYLERRQQGGAREYFRSRSAAYDFLIKVAPVKRVDGSWLFSTTQYAEHPHLHDLILIYLEELGLGSAQANHVCMYNQLLEQLKLSKFVDLLEDAYFYQPAIQLALAYAGQDMLPEIIGFNLGYEQLPLHLLISNYELRELGIDPQYFNVHITIDNAESGHASSALDALYRLAPFYPSDEFIERVRKGYALNDCGISSTEVINNIDLKALTLKVMQNKALVGQSIHSDRCQFKGKSINQWLSHPDDVAEFLDLLIEKNWIKLNQDPTESRFWNMIQSADGKMFGVFSSAERQIIYDWISNPTQDPQYASTNKIKTAISVRSQHSSPSNHLAHFSNQKDQLDIDQLNTQLNQADSFSEKVNILHPYLAPHMHHQTLGLWATRKYTQLLFPQELNTTF